MDHGFRYHAGLIDARDCVVVCKCGWRYSGTDQEIRRRAAVHRRLFADETRAWNDPQRMTEMPPAYVRFSG